jgi:hypothetical protein
MIIGNNNSLMNTGVNKNHIIPAKTKNSSLLQNNNNKLGE